MKRSLYTILHIITHVLRGVDTYTPLMRVTLDISYKSVIMVIVLIVYRMRVMRMIVSSIILLEFLLTITPFSSGMYALCYDTIKKRDPERSLKVTTL